MYSNWQVFTHKNLPIFFIFSTGGDQNWGGKYLNYLLFSGSNFIEVEKKLATWNAKYVINFYFLSWYFRNDRNTAYNLALFFRIVCNQLFQLLFHSFFCRIFMNVFFVLLISKSTKYSRKSNIILFRWVLTS